MSIFTFAIELWGCAYESKYLNQIDKFIKRVHKNGISKRIFIKEIRGKRDKRLWRKITLPDDNALLELLPRKKGTSNLVPRLFTYARCCGKDPGWSWSREPQILGVNRIRPNKIKCWFQVS